MPICIVVLSNKEIADQLLEKLYAASTPLKKCQLIRPLQENKPLISNNFSKGINSNEVTPEQIKTKLEPIDLEKVKLLNPILSRESRQQSMAKWLMPFGFITGLTFTQMTGLQTFSNLGINFLPESLLGSLLGMSAGWIGSHVSAATVNPEINEDINSLRKTSEEGRWLLLLETPFEFELPWGLLKEANPLKVVRLADQ